MPCLDLGTHLKHATCNIVQRLPNFNTEGSMREMGYTLVSYSTDDPISKKNSLFINIIDGQR